METPVSLFVYFGEIFVDVILIGAAVLAGRDNSDTVGARAFFMILMFLSTLGTGLVATTVNTGKLMYIWGGYGVTVNLFFLVVEYVIIALTGMPCRQKDS